MQEDEEIENKKTEGEGADRHSRCARWLAMTHCKECGVRQDTWVPLYRGYFVGREACVLPGECGARQAAG